MLPQGAQHLLGRDAPGWEHGRAARGSPGASAPETRGAISALVTSVPPQTAQDTRPLSASASKAPADVEPAVETLWPWPQLRGVSDHESG